MGLISRQELKQKAKVKFGSLSKSESIKSLNESAFSINSPNSKWMPWELGYFDGYKAKGCVLPLVDQPTISEDFKGTEFVGLYPYVVKTGDSFYIHENSDNYMKLTRWINGESLRSI